MIAKGLLQEVDAHLREGEPVWRETGDGHGVMLVATDAGRRHRLRPDRNRQTQRRRSPILARRHPGPHPDHKIKRIDDLLPWDAH